MAEIEIAGTDTQASINREALDEAHANRGTGRGIALARRRIFQVTPRRRLKGLVGYRRSPKDD